MANIPIIGSYIGGPLEARHSGGNWADVTLDDGNINTTIASNGTQGTLEIRFKTQTGIADSVAYVGVGDIILIAGQSNGVGQGGNYQTYSHATLKAAMYDQESDSWSELLDPTGVNYNAISGGSVWPLLATYIMADQGVPVAFIPLAVNGSKISAWQKGGTFYTRITAAVAAVGSIKAVLLYDGENDALVGTSEADFNSGLDSFVNDIMSDFGVKTLVATIHDTNYDETAVNNAIITAWSDNANALPGADNRGITTSPDTLHFTTDAELEGLAARWWAALQAGVYN